MTDGRRIYAVTLAALLVASAVVGVAVGGDDVAVGTPDDGDALERTADGTKYVVHPSELRLGCPGGMDCIPSIDDPSLQDAGGAGWLADEDLVIGLSVDGTHRAYPLRVLARHEIVNDRIAGRPVAVTYCPLCRSGLVFSRRVANATLTFGVSGRLHDANLVMYDRQTETYWSQLRGRAIVGSLVPATLEQLPSSITTWGEWRTAHPDTRVLSRDTGIYPPSTYGGSPYAGFANSSSVGFGVDDVDDRLPTKELVYGVTVGNASTAYPAEVVRERAVIEDTVDGVPLLIVRDPADGSVRVFLRRLDDETLSFTRDGDRLVDQHGHGYGFDGAALEGPHAGRELEQLPTEGIYWFAWSSVHPRTQVYRPNASVDRRIAGG